MEEVFSGIWFGKSGFFFFFFFKVRKQSQYFTATEEGGNDKRLLQLEFACKADDVA